MTAQFNSPGGNSPTVPFAVIGGLGWDLPSSRNCHLRKLVPTGPYLGASSGPDLGDGNHQGACISPTFSQSSGAIYWEILWSNLVDQGMEGGIGVGQFTGGAGQANAFGQLAADGTGGCIIRPNGDVWAGGTMVSPGSFTQLAQSTSETIGVLLTFNNGGPGITTVNFLGCSGTIANIIWGTALIPAGNYLPAVVFDSEISLDMKVIANFGGGGPDGFLGPDVFGTGPGDEFDPANGITLGWPNTL